MMYISFAVKIHRSTITTVARPQLTGSVEPVTRAKQHYITGYIQWHYTTHRSTDCTLLFFLCLSFLCFKACLFQCYENPPHECAKMTRQINAPKWPAKISCRGNLQDSPARIIRRIYSPEKSAISTRGLLARDPPFPAQNPQARPGPPALPPPQQLRQRSRGEGAGSRPGPPTHIEQVLLLSYEWLHILIWNDTYIFYTEQIKMKV